MTSRQTSALTLGVLGVLCVLMAVFGFVAVTRDFPTDSIVGAKAPLCENKVIKAGTKVRRGDVTVSVFNASGREGLASKTLEQLITRGFAAGESGNAPDAKVKRVQIRANDPKDPAARLVAAQFGPRTKIVSGRHRLGVGIVVVLGKNFSTLSKKTRKAIKVKTDITVCSPPLT